MKEARVPGMTTAGGGAGAFPPLARERWKPAVPFGGRHRIIDFVLSNFVTSVLLSIYVLVQYKSQSMIEHLRLAWRTGGLVPDHFITVVPPQMRFGESWYRGTADAVLQNVNLIDDYGPDLVAVFGADHIYRMDIKQMIAFHQERRASVTVASRPVPIGEASSFGILAVDSDGRVVSFEEKPARPRPMPDNPHRAYASMGNYVFSRQALVDTLLADARRSTDHDFGRTIIPELVPAGGVFANEGAVIEDSIVMDNTTVGKGARLRRAIVDRFNIIAADADMGWDPAADRRRYHVEPSGLVVIPRGGRREFLSGLEDF